MAAEKSTQPRPLSAAGIARMKPGDERADTGENRGLRVTKAQGDYRFWYRYKAGGVKSLSKHAEWSSLCSCPVLEMQRRRSIWWSPRFSKLSSCRITCSWQTMAMC